MHLMIFFFFIHKCNSYKFSGYTLTLAGYHSCVQHICSKVILIFDLGVNLFSNERVKLLQLLVVSIFFLKKQQLKNFCCFSNRLFLVNFFYDIHDHTAYDLQLQVRV